jgi:hypothetical protein
VDRSQPFDQMTESDTTVVKNPNRKRTEIEKYRERRRVSQCASESMKKRFRGQFIVCGFKYRWEGDGEGR